MWIRSDYETLVQSDEVTPIPDIKPLDAEYTHCPHKSVFDADYILQEITIKQEPSSQAVPSHTVISHIIDQPDVVTKAIKQELINSTVKDIADKHSASCALNVFIQEHGGASGLCIEDVRSLIMETSTPEVMPQTTQRLQTARRGRCTPVQGFNVSSSQRVAQKTFSHTSFSVVTMLDQNIITNMPTTSVTSLPMVMVVSDAMCLTPLTLHVVMTCSTGTTTALTLRMVTQTKEPTTGTVYPALSMVTSHEMPHTAMPAATTTTFSMITSATQPVYSMPITALPVVTDNAHVTTSASTNSSSIVSTSSNLRWSSYKTTQMKEILIPRTNLLQMTMTSTLKCSPTNKMTLSI